MVDKSIMRAKTDTPAAVWAKLNLIFDSEKIQMRIFLLLRGLTTFIIKNS